MEVSTQHLLNGVATRVPQVISDSLKESFLFFNYVTFGQAVNIFGMGTNIVSLVIFCKLGFKDTVNISLLGLTISDLLSLITLFFANICQVPSFQALELPFEPYDVAHMTVSWAHVGFTRITCYLTAFIALERCLCIAAPLKVKSILTPRRTALTVFIIFPILYMSVSPVYFSGRLTQKFSPQRNRTLIVLTFNDKQELMGSITSILNGVVPVVAFVIIVVCTALTVLQLKLKTKWRQQSAHAGGSKTSVSDRDRKVGLMVVLISSIFIACYLPSEMVFVWQFIDPEFDRGGARVNLFRVSVSFLYLLETINASVNIFVYLAMSSKYKSMFMLIFCRRVNKTLKSEHMTVSTY